MKENKDLVTQACDDDCVANPMLIIFMSHNTSFPACQRLSIVPSPTLQKFEAALAGTFK